MLTMVAPIPALEWTTREKSADEFQLYGRTESDNWMISARRGGTNPIRNLGSWR
jgi:hypothetical protein